MDRTATISAPAKAFAVFMAIAVAMALAPSLAYAASTKTVKKQSFTTETSVASKKATTVKKGSTKLVYQKGEGYIKFKAPKTKTYSFTFSNMKGSNASYAFVELQKVSSYTKKSITMVDMATKGGKSTALMICKNGLTKYGKGADQYQTKRTGKVKMQKGEWAYLYFSVSGPGKTTLNLNIK